MKLEAILAPAGWTVESITKIYSGLDHCCRCGCGGKYHERGTIGFKRILNKLIAGKVVPYPAGTERFVMGGGHNELLTEDGLDYGDNYINIPIDGTSNRCYCLYND